jgi:peptidoglycan/LPS O-acetylase OafA/YrhL
MTHPTPERAKIASLEGLRGVMAWWVVLGHVSLALGLHLPLVDDNVLAVDVFILLSGFVIFLLLDRKRESWHAYILRRAFRIFPLYLAVLFFSALLLPMQLEAWRDIPFVNGANIGRAHLAELGLQRWPAHLAVHIPLLQGIVPGHLLEAAPWTLVGQAWSVSLEWQFYLVAPLFFWLLATRRQYIRVVIALAVMAALAFETRSFTAAFIGARIWHFGLGMTSYLLLTQHDRRRALSALAALFAAIIVFEAGPKQLIPLGIWGVVLGSATAPVASRFRRVAAILGRPLFLRMGEMSYSVYLTHMIPLVLGIWILNQWHAGLLLYRVLLLLFVVFSTAILSRVTFRWIERPGIALGAALTEPRASTQPT